MYVLYVQPGGGGLTNMMHVLCVSHVACMPCGGGGCVCPFFSFSVQLHFFLGGGVCATLWM